jgi:hypothetical protein
MPDQFNMTTESELAEAVLMILALRASGSGKFEDLRRAIPKVIVLTAEDLATQPSRPTEEAWEQRVRNITSHAGSEGNYITDGFLSPIDGGLQITDAGRLRARPLPQIKK